MNNTQEQPAIPPLPPATGSAATWKLTWRVKGWINGHFEEDMTLYVALEQLKVLADDKTLEITMTREGRLP